MQRRLRVFARSIYYHYMAAGEVRYSRRMALALLCALPAKASRGRAEYIGGTVTQIAEGTAGLLKTTDEEYLIYATKSATLKVLYGRVNLLEYGQQVSRRYAMAVLLSPVFIMAKKRKHFLTIGFTDDTGKQQALVFLIDKDAIRALLASLEARTGQRVEFQDNEARKAGKG